MRRGGLLLPGLALAVMLAAPAARAAVEIEARVGSRTIPMGEATTLELHIRGAGGQVEDPDLNAAPGLDVLSSSRGQNFSWVNGRSSSEIWFRYEIGASNPGKYVLGPIQVQVAGQTYTSPAIEFTVSAGASRIGPGPVTGVRQDESNAASLLVEVDPRSPYVGQPVLLRVRLVQRAALAEDPDYTPPTTPGFWAERFRDPESYYASEGNRRVLVTETRARLIPLAEGKAAVGEARARLALMTGGPGADPLLWLGAGLPRRDLVVSSTPLSVQVRRLPGGAPDGFTGAVGRLSASLSVDRPRTAQDVPFTVRFDVRGVGNLPLIPTPSFAPADAEAFTGAVEDSAGAAGELSEGRRRFQWTVLAHRSGTLTFDAPRFVWFDPQAERYRVEGGGTVSIEVGPPLFAGEAGSDEYPAAFVRQPLDPGASGPEPWAWALAGLAAGGSAFLLVVARRAPVDGAVRAQQREWLRAVGLSQGLEFWHAADGATRWLGERGKEVGALRRDIEAARYSGVSISIEGMRRRLVEGLSRAVPPLTPRWPLQVAAVALAVAGLAIAVLFGPHGGESRLRIEAMRADGAARAGDVVGARNAWLTMWKDGAHAPGLAARLAWSEVRSGQLGRAACWVLRGDERDARDPALDWAAERVRETGGLVGVRGGRWPVRRLEWAIAAMVLGAAAGALLSRRWIAALLLAAALACAAAFPVQSLLRARDPRAVVLDRIALEGSGLSLEPGQVVRVRERSGERARVDAGADVVGWMMGSQLAVVADAP